MARFISKSKWTLVHKIQKKKGFERWPKLGLWLCDWREVLQQTFFDRLDKIFIIKLTCFVNQGKLAFWIIIKSSKCNLNAVCTCTSCIPICDTRSIQPCCTRYTLLNVHDIFACAIFLPVVHIWTQQDNHRRILVITAFNVELTGYAMRHISQGHKHHTRLGLWFLLVEITTPLATPPPPKIFWTVNLYLCISVWRMK